MCSDSPKGYRDTMKVLGMLPKHWSTVLECHVWQFIYCCGVGRWLERLQKVKYPSMKKGDSTSCESALLKLIFTYLACYSLISWTRYIRQIDGDLTEFFWQIEQAERERECTFSWMCSRVSQLLSTYSIFDSGIECRENRAPRLHGLAWFYHLVPCFLTLFFYIGLHAVSEQPSIESLRPSLPACLHVM